MPVPGLSGTGSRSAAGGGRRNNSMAVMAETLAAGSIRHNSIPREHLTPPQCLTAGNPHDLKLGDGVAGLDAAPGTPAPAAGNPFVSYDFLDGAGGERLRGRAPAGGPATSRSRTSDGALLGARAPLSEDPIQGEYVFDHGWADAYERAGGRYYPKLQVAVPFTPVTGPRLLVAPGRRRPRPRARRCSAAPGRGREQLGVSSLHVTFPTGANATRWARPGMLQRDGTAVSTGTTAATAASTTSSPPSSSRKRKTIRKERREAPGGGLEIGALTGADITDAALGRVLPLLHGHRRAQMGPALSDARLLLADRRAHGRPGPAGDGRRRRPLDRRRPQPDRRRRLYGRNWGCRRGRPVPAFRALLLPGHRLRDRARPARVEAGAQGEHKIARGYLPVETCSCHGSPTRASPRPSPISWRARRAAVRAGARSAGGDTRPSDARARSRQKPKPRALGKGAVAPGGDRKRPRPEARPFDE